MCGIVGFLSPPHFEQLRSDLAQATACLSHRGPNDEGLYLEQGSGLGLGHRRLSIIDLSPAGHQPMHSHDGRLSIVYNGEIYNFQALRKRLETLGHQFASHSDTEVILAAYQEYGTQCLQHFTGMFAFALWDKPLKRLLIARDRLGIKPLYYHHSGEGFIFASELKGIMAFSHFKKNVDPEAIPLLLNFGYIPAPKTIFQNTFKLLPGHYLLYTPKEPHIIKAYWSVPGPPPTHAGSAVTLDEMTDALEAVLTRAVTDCLVSDVPVGALLSGGIDSSLVVALMQQQSDSRVKTFSIGFENESYNEAGWAAQVADHLGTEHTAFYVTAADAQGTISRLPEMYDEPFADSSAVPSYLVSRLTRSQVTVALSGDGGDEQFCGYTRYWGTAHMLQLFKYLPQSMIKTARMLGVSLPVTWMDTLYAMCRKILPRPLRVENFVDKWQKLIELLHGGEITELYRRSVTLWSKEMLGRLVGRNPAGSAFEEAFRKTANWPVLSRLMYVDQKTYLPDEMLTKVDRASMAVGLEVRVPLLDHRVVEFSARVPENMRCRKNSPKFLLKRLLARYLPESMYERPKMGFGLPIGSWFRHELRPLILDYLSAERIKREGLFDHDIIATTLSEHQSGRFNHQHRLWCLLMWEMWRERWLG